MDTQLDHRKPIVQATQNIKFLEMMIERERDTLELFKSQLYYWENHGVDRLKKDVCKQYDRVHSLMDSVSDNYEKIILELQKCESESVDMRAVA